ncbi:MAG: hypothetical protein AAGD96_31175, partial [Chloroflexota bacterium]
KIRVELVPGGIGTPLLYPNTYLNNLLVRYDAAIVVAHSDQIEFEGDPAVFHVLGHGRDVRIVDGTSSFLLPKKYTPYLFTFDFIPAYKFASESTIFEPYCFQSDEVPRRAGEPPYIYFIGAPFGNIPCQPADSTPPSLPDISEAFIEELENRHWDLANGATLADYTFSETAANEYELITSWHIGREAEGHHFQQFNHLYVEGQADPYQIKDIYTSSRAWRAGDTLYTWTTFSTPNGETPDFIHTGMYTLPDVQRIPRLVPEGEDALFPIQLNLN